MNVPLISVIVPVYNTGEELKRCVDSILAQTECSLELILVDDGSTDGSGALCDGYAARDPRVRVLHRENAGVSAARNAGLDMARGEWVAFCDGDDWLEPDMYETLLGVGRTTGADCVFCGFLREFSDHAEGETYPEKRVLEADGLRTYVAGLMSGRYFGAVWRGLYTRESLAQCRFDREVHYAEDLLFLLAYLKGVRQAALTPETLYHYNKANENSVSARTERDPDFRYRLSLEKQLELNQYWNIPLDMEEFCKVYVEMMFQFLVRLLEEGNNEERVEQFLADPFFARCGRHDKRIPLRRRVICILIRHRRYGLAVAVRRLEDGVLRLMGR